MRYSNRSFNRQLDEAYRHGYRDAMNEAFRTLSSSLIMNNIKKYPESVAIYFYYYDDMIDIADKLSKISYELPNNIHVGIITNTKDEAIQLEKLAGDGSIIACYKPANLDCSNYRNIKNPKMVAVSFDQAYMAIEDAKAIISLNCDKFIDNMNQSMTTFYGSGKMSINYPRIDPYYLVEVD